MAGEAERTARTSRHRTRLELLDIAARSARIGEGVGVFVIGCLVMLLYENGATSSLTGWAVAIVLLSAARIALYRAWLARGVADPDVEERDLRRWENGHRALATASGVVWAMLLVASEQGNGRTALIVGFALTIALVLGSALYATDRVAQLSFALPVAIAQAIHLHRFAGDLHDLLALGWLALAVVLCLMPWISVASVRESLAARIDDERHLHEHPASVTTLPSIVPDDDLRVLAIEADYKHALQMQRLVFESAGEGIAIVDGGLIEQANQALSDLLGVPIAQLTSRPLQAIFEDPKGWTEIEERFHRLGTTLKVERRVIRSDGRSIWVNVTGRPVDPMGGARSIWVLADLSAQKQKETENWHHANHDVTTGLPNRRFLQDRLDQALALARRDGRRVAVLELDLDGFKSVNDSYGHRFGDAVLEEVARRLSTVVRELDTVGRWGGDEFVLVLKEIESPDVVEEMVKRVIARLTEPIVYEGKNLSVGASVGIALFPDHGDDVEVLMLAADLAMYESKGSGGNTWRYSSPATHARPCKYRAAFEAMLTRD